MVSWARIPTKEGRSLKKGATIKLEQIWRESIQITVLWAPVLTSVLLQVFRAVYAVSHCAQKPSRTSLVFLVTSHCKAACPLARASFPTRPFLRPQLDGSSSQLRPSFKNWVLRSQIQPLVILFLTHLHYHLSCLLHLFRNSFTGS